MADYGLRASQKGYDVQEASDSQLLFSSSWPLLKIEQQGSFNTNDVTVAETVYTHNLGYKPFFIIYETTDGTSRYATPLFDGTQFGVNTTELKFFGSYFRTGAKTFYYYIFRLPLTTDYEAPIINETDTTRSLIDNYGLKVTKQGEDISSTDMRDYVIHSSCRSPMVHKVDNGGFTFNGTDYVFSTTYSLSYLPWIRCFFNYADTIGTDTTYLYPYFGGNGSTYLKSTPGSVEIHNASGPFGADPLNATTVIFKDPFTI